LSANAKLTLCFGMLALNYLDCQHKINNLDKNELGLSRFCHD
jgi:hypothetical protein